VLEYVAKRLELPASAFAASRLGTVPAAVPLIAGISTVGESPHIEQFKEEKKPRSANEMAAVVAYYLANIAAPGERKERVTQRDIEANFKIARFPLPQHPRVTLTNAKNAGYFDLAGDGEYKLNAVGYNLVAHSMPRGPGSGAKKAGRRKGERRPARGSTLK
jgi:hypothetical protein